MHDPSPEQFADQLQLFYGDTSVGAARVYAQLDRDNSSRALQLSGSLFGPICPYARTLPTRFPLVDAGPGPTSLAQAVIHDPCFWSADMPYLYTAKVELRQSGDLVESLEREFGLRLLVARGNRLEWNYQPFALRGMYRPELSSAELLQFHADDLAVLTLGPNEDTCREASRRGVLLLAVVTGNHEQIVAELRRLSRWPAVGIVVVGADLPAGADPRRAAPNVLLAQLVNVEKQTPIEPIAPWANLLVVRDGPASSEQPELRTIERRLPLVLWSGDNVVSL